MKEKKASERRESERSFKRVQERLFNQSKGYFKVEEYSKEIEFYLKALEEKPEDVRAWVDLERACSIERSNLSKAIKYCQEALERKPDNYFAWTVLGYLYMVSGDYEQAIECHKKALEQKPDSYKVWDNLGIIHIRGDDHFQTIACYKELVKLKPDYSIAWFRLGLAYEALGEFSKAVDCFEKLVDLEPDKMYDYNLRVAREKAKDPKKAREKIFSEWLEERQPPLIRAPEFAMDNEEELKRKFKKRK